MLAISVGGCSVRSAWRGLETNPAPTAGGKTHTTSRITKVSDSYTHCYKMTQPCAGKREIKALGVKCSNMERGCEWVGTVGTLEEHVATCGFTLVPCPTQCKEAKHFLRKDLDRHLKNDCPNRHYECKSKKCGEKGTYAYITEVHDKTCKMKIVPCPNAGCHIKIQCQRVGEHASKCLHTVIPCKYKGIGCDTELKREDMAAHEQDDKLHLHMALETVTSLQDTVTSLQDESMTLDNKGSKIYTLSDFDEEKDASSDITFSNMSFYSHPKGYHDIESVCQWVWYWWGHTCDSEWTHTERKIRWYVAMAFFWKNNLHTAEPT